MLVFISLSSNYFPVSIGVAGCRQFRTFPPVAVAPSCDIFYSLAMKPTASKASAAEDRPVGDGTRVHLGPLAELVGYSLRRAQLAVFQDFIVKMKDFALRPAQFSVLAIIQANPGLKQSQVSEALGINRANFVALLDELEHRNLARRAPSPDDRRSNALYLTPQGEAFL